MWWRLITNINIYSAKWEALTKLYNFSRRLLKQSYVNIFAIAVESFNIVVASRHVTSQTEQWTLNLGRYESTDWSESHLLIYLRSKTFEVDIFSEVQINGNQLFL